MFFLTCKCCTWSLISLLCTHSAAVCFQEELDGLRSVLRNCPHLQHLNISGVHVHSQELQTSLIDVLVSQNISGNIPYCNDYHSVGVLTSVLISKDTAFKMWVPYCNHLVFFFIKKNIMVHVDFFPFVSCMIEWPSIAVHSYINYKMHGLFIFKIF